MLDNHFISCKDIIITHIFQTLVKYFSKAVTFTFCIQLADLHYVI